MIQVIREWQLSRLLLLVQKMWPKAKIMGFFIKPSGIDEVDIHTGAITRIVELDTDMQQWYRDNWFSVPHTALQVVYPDKALVVGFWVDNLYGFKQWLRQEIQGYGEDSSAAEGTLLGKL